MYKVVFSSDLVKRYISSENFAREAGKFLEALEKKYKTPKWSVYFFSWGFTVEVKIEGDTIDLDEIRKIAEEHGLELTLAERC